MGERLKARDLTDPKVQATFTYEKAMEDVKEGVTVHGRKVMPGYASKLSDEEIKALVTHLRTLKKK